MMCISIKFSVTILFYKIYVRTICAYGRHASVRKSAMLLPSMLLAACAASCQQQPNSRSSPSIGFIWIGMSLHDLRDRYPDAVRDDVVDWWYLTASQCAGGISAATDGRKIIGVEWTVSDGELCASTIKNCASFPYDVQWYKGSRSHPISSNEIIYIAPIYCVNQAIVLRHVILRDKDELCLMLCSLSRNEAYLDTAFRADFFGDPLEIDSVLQILAARSGAYPVDIK